MPLKEHLYLFVNYKLINFYDDLYIKNHELLHKSNNYNHFLICFYFNKKSLLISGREAKHLKHEIIPVL